MPIPIPQLESNVPLRPLPNVEAPEAAFGGGPTSGLPAAANNELQGAIQEEAQKQKVISDDFASKNAANQVEDFANRKTAIAKTMVGQDAFGLPGKVLPDFDQFAAKQMEGLQNVQQKTAFQTAILGIRSHLNEDLDNHEAGQIMDWRQGVYTSSVANSTNDAIQNYKDPNRLMGNQAKIIADTEDWAKATGKTNPDGSLSAEAQVTLRQQLSTLHTGVVGAYLADGNPDGAKAYLTANKANIDGDTYDHQLDKVNASQTYTIANQAWNQMKGLTLPDGNPDTQKMVDSIYARTDLTPQQKDDVAKQVNYFGRDQVRSNSEKWQAQDRQFMDQAYQLRKDEQPGANANYDQAMKLAVLGGRDQVDVASREKAVAEIWAPGDVKSDPQTWVNLWEGAQKGLATTADVDKAFQANQLSAEDWKSLRMETYKSNIEGQDPAMQKTMQNIDSLAQAHFGADKKGLAEYKMVVQQQSSGKTPQEAWTLAQDELNKTNGADYKSDFQKIDAQNQDWGIWYGTIGKDQITAIGAGILSTGQKAFGIDDLRKFAYAVSPAAEMSQQGSKVDPVQFIKPGTPANEAMQSLMRRNLYVTPGNVKWVLQKYPDGVY